LLRRRGQGRSTDNAAKVIADINRGAAEINK
jgi:hypothetical protein